jgi:alkaline phosphatase D
MNNINPLTVGPIVGHADVNHVRIWGRAVHERTASGAPRRSFGIARLRRKIGGTYGSPRFFKMNPNFDMTGVVTFTSLTPDTKYIYQMGWFHSDKELSEFHSSDQWNWHNAEQGEFQTASSDPNAEREFIFGSCRYLLRLFGGSWFDDRGDKTFRSILTQWEHGRTIDKLLMVGDQIYADDLNFLTPDKQVDEYLARYRDAFSQPHIRELMSRVSTYMTLDDHEIEDNWPSKADDKDMMIKYPAAVHAYQVYQMSHSPLLSLGDNGRLEGAPDRYHYRFIDGCCDFFVTDTRTERDPVEKEMVSEEQMKDLLDWLQDDSGCAKLIVTSVPFFPDTKKSNEDKWSGYKQQRDQIIAHIRTHKVKKVIFLSGDVHCSMAAELDISDPGGEPLKIYSIISSAFYWPYPHTKRRKFQLTGFVASSNKDKAYELGEISEVYSGDNFSRVRVSDVDIEIEVYERKGELKHSIRYQF